MAEESVANTQNTTDISLPSSSDDTKPPQASSDSNSSGIDSSHRNDEETPRSSDETQSIPPSSDSNSPDVPSMPQTDEAFVDIQTTQPSDSSGIGSSPRNDDEIDAEFDENDLMLPKDMIEEERKCRIETEQAISRLAQNTVELADEEKKKRYQNVMKLLGKSKQYALYMSEKLNRDKAMKAVAAEAAQNEALKEISQNTTPKGKRKQPSRSKAAKRMKMDDSDVPKGYYRNERGFIVSERQPKLLCGGVMRDYQLDGLEWLVTLYRNAVNGILADEMGLGKTIQVISLICHLREKNIFGPHVIIAPLSTLPNWISEFALFSPSVPVMLFHGNDQQRDALKREFAEIIRSKDKKRIPVVLTSYEMPLRDKKFFNFINWCYTIVDEGHRLKNYRSLLGIELRKYKTESRLLLTGTPLQNNLSELWSLLNYLIPDIFDDLPMFESLFDFTDLCNEQKQKELIEKEKQEQIISKMHEILEPFLLRRLKCDVHIELPRKKEVLVYAPLTSEQKELYVATMERTFKASKEEEPDLIVNGKIKRKCTQNREFCYNDDWSYDKFEDFLRGRISAAENSVIVDSSGKHFYYNIKMANPVMQLRKIVNHPYLVKCPIVPGTRNIIIDEEMITKSGKLLVLDALLPKLKQRGHKILLFSTFKIMLDLIEDYVIMRDYKFVRLDGNYGIQDRLEAIKQFNADPNIFIFLISTRAGGLGINLTAADTVIIFDSDWNPQVDLQAQDRCHRIGQTKPVMVYRLVTSGTIDEKIVDCATGKRRLEKLVVKKGKFKQQGEKEAISINELKELLNSTDHKHVFHQNGLVLSDEHIEHLLDRSEKSEE